MNKTMHVDASKVEEAKTLAGTIHRNYEEHKQKATTENNRCKQKLFQQKAKVNGPYAMSSAPEEPARYLQSKGQAKDQKAKRKGRLLHVHMKSMA